MKYLTGVFALNIEDSLETCGDWHTSALNWSNIVLKDTENSLFGEWGIEIDKVIPEHEGYYNVANTLRAVLDLMIEGKTDYLKGFYNDFFSTDIYNTIFFEKVIQLKSLSNWEDINNLMKREFMWDWDSFIGVKKDKKAKVIIKSEQEVYFNVMKDFLMFLNSKSDRFVLKNGTALSMCYNLDRFSEDIDLDGFDKNNFFKIIELFVLEAKKKYPTISYRKGKNTDTVKRAFIHYGGIKPLKVEVSYRLKSISNEEYCKINGIVVYNIQNILSFKLNAFNSRNKIRDLSDIVFIYMNYKKHINKNLIDMLSDAIAFKGIEQFDYLIKNQTDELIDNDKLAENFLSMYYDLGLN